MQTSDVPCSLGNLFKVPSENVLKNTQDSISSEDIQFSDGHFLTFRYLPQPEIIKWN